MCQAVSGDCMCVVNRASSLYKRDCMHSCGLRETAPHILVKKTDMHPGPWKESKIASLSAVVRNTNQYPT